jgi:Baseplate J-like protein
MNATKDRRQKLLDQSPALLNGIDYVIVANPATAIEVRFLNAAPVAGTVSAATITGGQTFPSVAVTSLRWSTGPERRPVLTLHLATTGDSSPYTLALKSPKLDPYFSRVTFSFMAGEPSTLDCRIKAPAPQPQPPSAPPIDYLSKDFLSFRKALSDFSTLKYPAWQERSEADFGVMFMEALCALGDDLSYQQDRIAAEAYLDTATERLSVVRHARLVDYEPTPALAASVTLQFTVYGSTTDIPSGLAVSATGPDGAPIYFETGVGLTDTKLYRVSEKWNLMSPYWWDSSGQILRPGAMEMWVSNHGLGFMPGDSLLLDTQPGDVGQPDIREAVVIASADEQNDELYNVEVTHLVFQNPLSNQLDLSATVVRGNLVPATEGLRYSESFAIGAGLTGIPLAVERTGSNQTTQYLYTLGNAPLTWLADASAAGAVAPAPEILLTQQLAPGNSGNPTWTWFQSLLDAPAFASGFTIDPIRYDQLPPDLSSGSDQLDYDGSNGDTIRFGFGDFGAIPASSSTFSVVYRAGGGSAGNVAADSITTIDPTAPVAQYASAVTNPFPAMGGADAEPIATVVRLAPYTYQSTKYNAALPADYVAAAETLPWVARAGCTIRHTGSWLAAFTTVEPVADEYPMAAQTRELAALLDRYRMAGSESHVLRPNYLSLDLQITVAAEPDAVNGNVAAAILQALGTGVLPNGSSGFFAHGNFTFGQPLERSALEGAIQRAQGVAGVSGIRYRRSGSTAAPIEMTDEVQAGINEIIRVDNSPAKAAGGSISLVVTGGK